MKLATYINGFKESFGVVLADGIFDVPSALPDGPRDLLALLEAGEPAIERVRRLAISAGPRLPLESVRLLAPLPRPPKLLGLAVNYPEHHREMNRGAADLPDDGDRRLTPRPFLMPQTCVIGPGAEITWPCYSRQIDHEVELAVVIGRPCKDVSPAQARRYIAGYTIANDVSARSCTHAEGRTPRPKDDFFDWLHGKWADGFCPLGPVLVTADEILDPQSLKIELLVNGEVRQSSSTAEMIFSVDETVAFCSRLMTLLPGDVIATGTPSGVGKATGKWLRGGDVMACLVEGIGELVNTLSAQPKEHYTPCR